MESGATGDQGTSFKEQKENGSTGSRRKWHKDRLKRAAGALQLDLEDPWELSS